MTVQAVIETAVQLSVVALLVVAEAARPAGVVGTATQLEQEPTLVQGWPLPAPPLFEAGS